MTERVAQPFTAEKVFVGSWNAIKRYPEWWGKQTVALYDRFRFPKFTPEEQKVDDKVHTFLKKYQNAIGWTETGLQAILLSLAVRKGYRWLRDRRALGAAESALAAIPHARLPGDALNGLSGAAAEAASAEWQRVFADIAGGRDAVPALLVRNMMKMSTFGVPLPDHFDPKSSELAPLQVMIVAGEALRPHVREIPVELGRLVVEASESLATRSFTEDQAMTLVRALSNTYLDAGAMNVWRDKLGALTSDFATNWRMFNFFGLPELVDAIVKRLPHPREFYSHLL